MAMIEPDADTMRRNTIALLDQVKTLLEDFITNILSEHPPQYFARATVIHMRHQSRELLELTDMLLSGGNFGLFDLELQLLQELRPQIHLHIGIIQTLERHNGNANLQRPIQIPQNLQNDLLEIANNYRDIDRRLREVNSHSLPPGQVSPQGPQSPQDQ